MVNGELIVAGVLMTNKELINKILGPTAEYLGEGIKNFTQKRVENIKRIFISAEKKLGEKINEPGSVPPQVLRRILDEGSFVEDELSAEYFGGCLASSRSNISRDNRVFSILRRYIEPMSNYEIRTHYFFYSLLRQEFLDTDISILTESEKMTIFIPISSYGTAMDFSENEPCPNITSHSLTSLSASGLLSEYSSGSKEFLQKRYIQVDSEGIIATPTILGAQVFLYANGLRDTNENDFISSKISLPLAKNFILPKEVKRLRFTE